MKIFSEDTAITSGLHILETPKDIIINSQLYDKYTMHPRSFQFFNTSIMSYFGNLLERSISKVGYSPCVPNKDPDYKNWIQDSENEDIFYCITPQGTGPTVTTQSILKIREKDDSWEIEKQVNTGMISSTFTRTSGATNYKFLGQTTKYILTFQCSGGYYAGYGSYPHVSDAQINRHSKSNLGVSVSLYDGAIGKRDINYYPIKITESYLYLYRYCGGNFYISRYNIECNTMEDLYTKEPTVWSTGIPNTIRTIGTSNIIKFKDKYYTFTSNETNDAYCFREFSINFDTDIITEKIYELAANEDFPFIAVPVNALSSNWLIYSLKNINDQYIAITVHDNENQYHYGYCDTVETKTIYSANSRHKHLVCRFVEGETKEEDSFVIKDIIKFIPDTTHVYGVVYLNERILILLTETCFSFYEFNLETETYDKRYEKTGIYNTIGFDSVNRFYAIDNSDNCYIYTNITAVILDVRFEKEAYSYDGINDIVTYVTVDTKNFLLENVQTEVTVSLIGACEFANGTKEYTFTTPTSSIKIPVTVTGGGKVSSYIKQKEVF